MHNMKKKYQKPTVKVIEVKQSGFLCTSSYDGAPQFDWDEEE
jgi:hypothetical protein